MMRSAIGLLLFCASLSVAQETKTPLGALPATFTGDLPCADCKAIRYQLNLLPDNAYFLRMTYLGKPGKPVDDIGRWSVSATTLKLNELQFSIGSKNALKKLDNDGRNIPSKLNYELKRSSRFRPFEPQVKLRGMFQYMADAATFTDCKSGLRWPVSMERDYRSLESAYTKLQHQPGAPVLAAADALIAMRPKVDSKSKTATFVVERFTGLYPGESCSGGFGPVSLYDIRWKLTMLGNQPVTIQGSQREPYILFRKEKHELSGYGGCNGMGGSYKLNGDQISFGQMISTQRACMDGSDVERSFFGALGKAKRWKVEGQQLELFDSDGKLLARFEARPLK